MMKDQAEKWNCMDIMNCSHFCYHPINGCACGMCGPCRVKIKQYMDFLFKPEFLKIGLVCNYLYKNKINDVFGNPAWVSFENYIRNYKFKDLFSDKIYNKNIDYQSICYFEDLLKNSNIGCRSV